MRISELIVRLQDVLAREGDLNIFVGDCVPMEPAHFQAVDTISDCPKERELLGSKYLEASGW